MNRNFINRWLLLTTFILVSLMSSDINAQVVAQDGTKYNTTKIGDREWLTTNLNVSTFNDGTTILQVKSVAEWIKAYNEKKPAYCYYDFQDSNGTKYGKIYNSHVLNNPLNVAPIGWHVPTVEDWKELIATLGGNANKEKIVNELKAKTGWTRSPGNNKTGFTALGSGTLIFISNKYLFQGLPNWARYWSSSYYTEGYFKPIREYFYQAGLNLFENTFQIDPFGFNEGSAIRCIKDKK